MGDVVGSRVLNSFAGQHAGAAESFDSYVMYDDVPLLGVMIR